MEPEYSTYVSRTWGRAPSWRRLCAIAVLALASVNTWAAIFVGRPTKGSVVELGGLQVNGALVDVAWAEARDCNGQLLAVWTEVEGDYLDDLAELSIPEGSCSLLLEDQLVEVEGSLSGGDYLVVLEIEEQVLAVPGGAGALLLEVAPDWAPVLAGHVSSGSTLVVDWNHALHDDLEDEWIDASALVHP